MIDYVVTTLEHSIRRNNWKAFVKNINGEKKSKIALLTIHFNNFENIKYLINYVSNIDIDFVIVENSTKDEEKIKLEEHINKYKQNITIINPINNIWSAGGYALWMEYIIDSNYDYFFIIEDDVIFLEKDTIKELLENIELNTLLFINNCKNTWDSIETSNKWHSWRVQVAWYPTSFVKKIWIIDPRYFFRWEDLERWYKIECWIKKYKYETKIYNKNYMHPYLKPVNKNYSFAYFSIRNQLFSLMKNWIEFRWILFTLYSYISSWLSKIVTDKNTQLIKSVLSWVKDFLKLNYSFESNISNIWNFINSKTKVEKIYNISELKQYFWKCYWNKSVIQITWYNNEMLPKYSNNILSIFYWIITSSNSTALTFLTLLSKKVINIETISINNDDISLNYRNKKLIEYVISIFVFIPILLVSICIYIPILLAVIRRITICKNF